MYWTVLCYHPYLVSTLFADLLSLHSTSCYIFNVFYSCSCHFFSAADACLSWSLPSITEQQVSPHRLPMQYWLKNHRLSSNSPSTPTVFPNSAILRNNYISLLSDLCACVHVKKKWRRKGSHSSSVSGSNRLVWLQTWKKRLAGALLSEKCCCFVRKPSWKIHANLN